jgi:glycine cleavage system aminomethyltransferase T
MAFFNAKQGLDLIHISLRISGSSATAFLSTLLPSDLDSLKPMPLTGGGSAKETYASTLSVMMNPDAGIIDDLVVTKWNENE